MDTDSAVLAGVLVGTLISLTVGILLIVCTWRVYTKAGRPGWASIVPFYNFYVLLKIVGRPGWWLVLFFVPVANVVVLVIVCVDLAVSFGEESWFALLLIFLPFVGYPILAFGDATYRGPLADPAYRHHIAQPPPPYHPQQGFPSPQPDPLHQP